VIAGNNELASNKLKDLKVWLFVDMMLKCVDGFLQNIMIDLDSLPPICLNTANAVVERSTAKLVLEYAVLLSVNIGDKESFNRNMSCLRPFYANVM
jgi:hypothetical protein